MPQFMPSSYRRYAVSASQRRAPDLVNNVPDVLWSIANYVKKFGWKPNEPIAVLANVSHNASCSLTPSSKPSRTLAAFSRCGVDSRYSVAPNHTLAALQSFEMKRGQQYWLTFRNFQVITRYNTSPLYALAVFQLSNALEYRNENPLLRQKRHAK
jgi:membrane-bound lytic murein transglycosylase B